MDLRDTRQLVVERSPLRDLLVGLSCLRRRPCLKVGRRPGGCRRAPFFGETLIHCRSARESARTSNRACGVTGGRPARPAGRWGNLPERLCDGDR
jgi:hypothetical protein